MIKRSRLLPIFGTVILLCADVASAELTVTNAKDHSRFHVLLTNDLDQNRSASLIADIASGKRTGFSIGALNSPALKSAGRLVLGDGGAQSAPIGAKEPARNKLARYLVLELDDSVNANDVLSRLRNDSEVEYAGVDTQIPGFSDSCSFSPTVVSYSSFSKTWGRSKVRATQGWAYSTGHSYVGVVDNGIQMDHADVIDFSGSSYMGGNFHPHISFDVGNRVDEHGNSTPANPYVGQGYFEEVDEYQPKVHPIDNPDCDDPGQGGNDNGFQEAEFAGHGTAVFGTLAANTANSDDAKGLCPHCPATVARASYVRECDYGTQAHTQQSHEAEAHHLTVHSFAANTAFAIDIGVQVINMSGGVNPFTSQGGRPPSYCDDFEDDPWCLVIDYANDRDVVWVAAAGNENAAGGVHFPANQPSVIGVMGMSPDSSRWNEGIGCGSNYGGSSNTGAAFIAPAEGIYTTMYADMNWSPAGCHEYNDNIQGNGFGYCTGTSLAAPHVAGIAALVRSVNPLMSKDDVLEAMRSTTHRVQVAGKPWSGERGWGSPRADFALKTSLAVVGGNQVRNRAIPLFDLYSSSGEDYIQTTKPQVAVAFSLNTAMNISSPITSPYVAGYSYPESNANPNPPGARAALYVLSTHYSTESVDLIPIYRMRWVGSFGGNPNDTDWAIVTENDIEPYRAAGYDLDGMEGYIYEPCTPEPSCIPASAVKVYTAYNLSRDDHLIFPESQLNAKLAAGYDDDVEMIGYAYPNADNDGDGLVNGLERVIGTDHQDSDTDNDGISDGVEYSLAALPVSDPDD